MTTWTARPAKRGNLLRLLCGRKVAGQYRCDAEIAYIYTDDLVVVPNGLTDAGTPGHWRWSSYALARIARGAPPDLDKRPGLPVTPDTSTAAVVAVVRDAIRQTAAKGIKRLASVPLTLPCTGKHENEITGDVVRYAIDAAGDTAIT